MGFWVNPIGSMYGIFTYIWLTFMVNKGKYLSVGIAIIPTLFLGGGVENSLTKNRCMIFYGHRELQLRPPAGLEQRHCPKCVGNHPGAKSPSVRNVVKPRGSQVEFRSLSFCESWT